MPSRRSTSERDRLLTLVAAGGTPADAGIPTATVRSWRRRDPAFARRYAEAQASAAKDASAPLTPEEWRSLLAARCRAGSVQALQLWKQTYGVERDTASEAKLIRLRAIGAGVERER